MGTKYSITDHAVGTHATNLDASTASMNQNLSQFIGALAGLPGVWKGASFSSFDQIQTRWTNATRDLNSALTDITSRVGSSSQIYDRSHAEQTSNLNSLNASANWDDGKFKA